MDARSSNTAPGNDIGGAAGRILLHGIDSLYLSCKGQLSESALAQLEQAKVFAQSRLPEERAKANIKVGSDFYEVLPSGRHPFPFVIANNTARIKLGPGRSGKVPVAACQLLSKWIHGVGCGEAVAHLEDQLRALATLDGEFKVSRADLYTDFTFPAGIDRWSSDAWIGRSREFGTFESKGAFTGWTIGRGGKLSARLYDKTIELKKSGKDYFKELWTEGGWDGESPVFRQEFQFRSPVLREFGVVTYADLVSKHGALWAYAVCEWLSLRLPKRTDSRRTRWPLHPLWELISKGVWPQTLPALRTPVGTDRPPNPEALAKQYMGTLTSYMGCQGIQDPFEASDQLLLEAQRYCGRIELACGADFVTQLRRKAAIKANKYNRPFPGCHVTGSAHVERERIRYLAATGRR